MWNLITDSKENGEWINLREFGYQGLFFVESIQHIGKRGWIVVVQHYGGPTVRLRVGKTKVLEVLGAS